MKLIDLLVQELPKRGGRPVAVSLDFIQWCNKHHLKFEINHSNSFFSDLEGDYVSFLDYQKAKQAALAAAKQPVWNGEGLPPVGCECEARYREADGAEWFFFRCVGVDCGIAFGWAGKEAVTLGKGSYEFRPIRSGADKNREEGVIALAKAGGALEFKYGEKLGDSERLVGEAWYELYDKIAAGEVKGVKLDV